MAQASDAKRVPLEAKSPFDLRVDLGNDVPETDVRTALAQGDMGFLHSFTTGSAVDGPGIRVVGWTTGCMWRCQYCHNPDTWTMRNGIPVSVAQALEELGKYRHGLKIMSSDADLDTIDLVLLGIKTWGRERHRALTGRDPEPTLEFARRLAKRGQPLWVRFVLVPGLTDDAADIAQIATFAASLGNVQRVEVLPFHQMGRFKWETLGIRYALESTEPPSPAAVAAACGIFRAQGLRAD